VIARIGLFLVIASGVAAAGPSVAQSFVDAHNADRAKHCAKPLAWSNEIARVAQAWADQLRAKGCVLQHSNNNYGENLAAGTAGTLDPDEVVKLWYDEGASYRFRDGGFSMSTGHFTQLVWRATTKIGCGHTMCDNKVIWVCNYDTAGNVEGEYRENVLPATCKR
jgi:uncharacterized protein YkwD